jgi:hypothetical protein
MTENIEDIIKVAKENNYNPMDMVIAANIIMIDQLKEKVKEKGGHIDFPKGYYPYMVCVGTEVCEVRVKKIYLDAQENVKIEGDVVDCDYYDTFNIDEFILGQISNVLSLIED